MKKLNQKSNIQNEAHAEKTRNGIKSRLPLRALRTAQFSRIRLIVLVVVIVAIGFIIVLTRAASSDTLFTGANDLVLEQVTVPGAMTFAADGNQSARPFDFQLYGNGLVLCYDANSNLVSTTIGSGEIANLVSQIKGAGLPSSINDPNAATAPAGTATGAVNATHIYLNTVHGARGLTVSNDKADNRLVKMKQILGGTCGKAKTKTNPSSTPKPKELKFAGAKHFSSEVAKIAATLRQYVVSDALAATFVQSSEDILYNDDNSYRTSHGLSPVMRSSCLTTVARNWAMHMGVNTTQTDGSSPSGFYHQGTNGSPTAWSQYNYYCGTGTWNGGGEILGWAWPCQNPDTTGCAQVVFNGFLNSPAHLAVISTGAYNVVGVGAYLNDNKYLLVAEEFAKCNTPCGSGYTMSSGGTPPPPPAPAPTPPPASQVNAQAAFQANTGYLWDAGHLEVKNWGLGMNVKSSPSIAKLTNGTYEMAMEANTDILYLANTATGYSTNNLSMMDGTSPSICALTTGGFEVAFQANTSHLWTMGNAGWRDWGLGMNTRTSPSITCLPGGGYEVVMEANTDQMYIVNNSSGYYNSQINMADSTSPSVCAVPSGGFEVAFQATDHSLWTIGNAGWKAWGLGMMPGSSPSIACSAGGYEAAMEANTAQLYNAWDINGSLGYANTQYGMYNGSSPSITSTGNNSYETAFMANSTSLYMVGSSGNQNTGLGMQTQALLGPSIAPL